MTTSSFAGFNAIVIASATDAWFRNFERLSLALTAIGLAKTSDTGQVNWATVTVPGSNVETAYEIRQFSDSEQATDPIFFKIIYGHLNSTNAYPYVRISVGSGSDGAGNLTDAAPGSYFGYLTNTSGAPTWYITSDGSGFALIAGAPQATVYSTWILLERAKDQNGDGITGQVFGSVGSIVTPSGSDYTGARSYVMDLVLNRFFTSDIVPVQYWKDLSSSTATLAMGTVYPFGVLMIPTPAGHARSRLMVGVAQRDFVHGTILDLPRFSSNEVTPYRVFNEMANYGMFGITPAGMGTTAADSPSTYGMPCLYWA